MTPTPVADSESRFTPSTSACPQPQRWHAHDEDSAEVEVAALVAAFARALQPDIVVETGSAWGHTAREIGLALAANGQGVLHTIEPDPRRADATRRRCDGLPVVVEQMSSLEWQPPGPVGLAWLDSLIPLRAQELRRLRPHLAPGAVVGIHDTDDRHGLWPAVEQLVDEGVIGAALRLATPRGVAFAQVRP